MSANSLSTSETVQGLQRDGRECTSCCSIGWCIGVFFQSNLKSVYWLDMFHEYDMGTGM